MIKVVKRDFVKKGFVKGFLLLFLIFSFIVQSKTRINVDGSININWDRDRDRNRRDRDRGNYWENENDGYSYVGDITDNQYLMKPFVLNGKGYSVLSNRGTLYLLQAEFYNSDPSRVKNERIFNTNTYSSNCLAIAGDNRYCLTINVEGSPALWDRQQGRIKYVGKWLQNNNSYNYDYDYYYYQNSNQHWFEW